MKSISISALLTLLLFLGSGCSLFIDKPTRVLLKHPETLEFVNCNVDQWETSASYKSNEECIKDYEAQGYVVWDSR